MERVRSASVSEDQKNERNKRWCEAYKRKKEMNREQENKCIDTVQAAQ